MCVWGPGVLNHHVVGNVPAIGRARKPWPPSSLSSERSEPSGRAGTEGGPPGATRPRPAGDEAEENVRKKGKRKKITAAPRPPAARRLLSAALRRRRCAASRLFLPADGQGGGPRDAANPQLSVPALSVTSL